MDWLDLADLTAFKDGMPFDYLDGALRQSGLVWHDNTRNTPDGVGFWCAFDYASCRAILRDDRLFSSVGGGHRVAGGTLLNDVPEAGSMLLMMDDPEHRALRAAIDHSFSPGSLGRMTEFLQAFCREQLSTAGKLGVCDGVALAGEVGLAALCELLSIPREDRRHLGEMVDRLLSHEGRSFGERTDSSNQASADLALYGLSHLGASDLTGLSATLASLSPREYTVRDRILMFMVLFIAGFETIRSAISAGLLAFAQRPGDWRDILRRGSFPSSAREEILRWSSPSAFQRRTVTQSASFGGVSVSPGDKVVAWLVAANRDPRVFAAPATFDINRRPNPHLAFGFGIHNCLGSALARLELDAFFDGLVAERLEPEVVGDLRWLPSNRLWGLAELPIKLRPAGR